MLNNDQQTCYDFLKDKESGYFLIEGFAGTGKTYLAQELIKHYLSLGKKLLVLHQHIKLNFSYKKVLIASKVNN